LFHIRHKYIPGSSLSFPEDIENEKLSDVQASEKYLHGSEYSISSVKHRTSKTAITTMLG